MLDARLKKKKTYQIILYTLVSVSPFLITALHSLFTGVNLFLGKPHNSDEFNYWRVLYSFSKCGFDFASTCGYLNTDAVVGPLGEHGLATLFAWSGALFLGEIGEHTLFLYNLFILAISIGIFLYLVKPSFKVVVFLLIALYGNGVVVEQWFSHMMELPCIAVIIMYFAMQIMYERTERSGYAVLAAMFCIYASYMRICYIVLAFPLMIDLTLNIKTKYRWIPFGSYFVLFYIIRSSQSLFMKRSDSFLTDMYSMDIRSKFSTLYIHFCSNFQSYFNHLNGDPIEVIQRYWQVVIFMCLILMSFVAKKDSKCHIAINHRCFSTAVSLGGLIVMMMLLYDISDWRDVRTTMPYAIGASLWLMIQCDDAKNVGGRINAKIDVQMIVAMILFVGAAFISLKYASYRYSVNHPSDRWEEVLIDDAWIYEVPNENSIVCLYKNGLKCGAQFGLYKKLPPHVGVLIARDYDELVLSEQNISYVITSEEINISDYELLQHNEDFGYIYRKVD